MRQGVVTFMQVQQLPTLRSVKVPRDKEGAVAEPGQ